MFSCLNWTVDLNPDQSLYDQICLYGSNL